MKGMLTRGGCDIDATRKQHNVFEPGFLCFPFSSGRKRMSTIIENATG
jgi:magnesium-transporting ATPase (P-type)